MLSKYCFWAVKIFFEFEFEIWHKHSMVQNNKTYISTFFCIVIKISQKLAPKFRTFKVSITVCGRSFETKTSILNEKPLTISNYIQNKRGIAAILLQSKKNWAIKYTQKYLDLVSFFTFMRCLQYWKS